MGPLISERQRGRVLGYVATGVDEGATVALGGGVPAHLPVGWYVEPTVLTGVDPDATVAQEEIFGPVLVVLAHDGDDHAVAVANNSVYGLSGAVYSGSIERARGVAARIRTGTIGVNGGLFYSPDVPFGGYRQSGIGREMGIAGFEEYLETKSVAEGVSERPAGSAR
jgi:aldehyde dehydrogenase (NAD+)